MVRVEFHSSRLFRFILSCNKLKTLQQWTVDRILIFMSTYINKFTMGAFLSIWLGKLWT